MGISISSKQKPKNLDVIDQERDVSPSIKRKLQRTSSRYLKFSDSGYPTTPQSLNASDPIDNFDILSIDDCWIPKGRIASDSKRNCFQRDNSSEILDENGIFFGGVRNSGSIQSLDIPGTVTSKDSIRNRDKRRRTKTLSSSRTQDVRVPPETSVSKSDVGNGEQEKKPSFWEMSADESSSDVESEVESDRRRRSTSNPKNRPGAARPGRRRGRVYNAEDAGIENRTLGLSEYISSQIPEVANLLQPGNSLSNNERSKWSRKKYELKVSINPKSSVCEIILPGTILFPCDEVTKIIKKNGLKRHRSLHLPRFGEERNGVSGV